MRQRGMVLVTTLMLLVVLVALLAALFVTTNIELASTKFSRDSTKGFFTAEGGLNIRAEQIRQVFVGYNRPQGVSPLSTDPCEGTNLGEGDFACSDYVFNTGFGPRTARTYIEEDPGNPVIITIPPGERYQYLNAQEYRYTARAIALDSQDRTEALLELRFKSRLVPLFQFAAFYDKDLEILPGPTMTLAGPVHTNGDLYLNTENSSPGFTVQGQVTTAGNLYRGRKNTNVCNSNPVRVYNPLNPLSLVPTCSSRVEVESPDVTGWNGMIQIGVPEVTVPEPEVLDPEPGQVYWDKADLRVVLALDAGGNLDTTYSTNGVQVRNQDDSVNVDATNILYACSGYVRRNGAGSTLSAVGTSNAFYNNREALTIRMLDVDMRSLFDCLHNSDWFGSGKELDDDSEGGLVLYFTVVGPNSEASSNNYGVRIRNGSQLRATVGGAPLVRGVTVVSNQAVYVQGDYNATNRIPAAVLSDSFNVLSQYWFNSSTNEFRDSLSTQVLTNRPASNTTQNLAILSGTDTTGGVEGEGGQGGAYNGGLENYPRFHENWSGRTYTYNGSFVSLNRPRHVDGAWLYGAPQYTAPNRVWNYDTSFNNAANLPPLTPRFVYLRQELFVRDFEQ